MARQNINDFDLVLRFDPADERRLRDTLSKLQSGVIDLDPFWDAAEMHMIDSLTRNFEEGGRPRSWAPLSDVTIELKGSDAILQDTGDLKNSVNAQNTERTQFSLKLWAGDEKATFHQFTDMDPLDQWGVENARGMPMRPFILFQDEDVDEIENILKKYIDTLI